MIDIEIIVQAKTFLLSILFGWFIGAAYDLWRFAWKNIWNTPMIMDMFFWILTGIGLFVFTACENEGTIRSYLFLGWLTGWLLYRYIFQKIFKRACISGKGLLKKIKKKVKISIGRR
ncbi:MAG: spore cortex biosynthesis protein YabQ [Lachnospiraceae bacterium]|nr:spore cortex biosynthesis protein YabQ [Lachnospiraceae bacterium]